MAPLALLLGFKTVIFSQENMTVLELDKSKNWLAILWMPSVYRLGFFSYLSSSNVS